MKDKIRYRDTRFSRRQFFKRIGLTVGGVAVSSMALMSACNKGVATPESTETMRSNTTSPETNIYVPSTPSTLIPVPNSSCYIVNDRLYSLEHVWVEEYKTGFVALGITPSLIAILYQPYNLQLAGIGSVLARENTFGEVNGYKTTADLTMPVSGTIIQRNDELLEEAKTGGYLALLNAEPFGNGWLVAVKLSKPDELNDLMSPEGYIQRLVAG